MNLLPKHPIRTLVSLASTATALALVAAAPASAADLPWTLGEGGALKSTDISITINDSEQFSTEQQSWWDLHFTWGWLGYHDKGWTETYEKCGGNEVRAQIELTARTNVFQVYSISARAKLYEGATCNTNDLDGKTPYRQIVLRPGEETSLGFQVANTEEGGDSATIRVDLKAPPVVKY